MKILSFRLLKPLAAAALAAALCLPAPAGAEKLTTDYFTIDMPDSWQRLQDSSSNTFSISVYSTKNRDTVLTTVIGTNGGADVATITKSFSQQYRAERISVKNGQGTFWYTSSAGIESSGYVTVQDANFMVVTVSGSLRKARVFMKSFSSNDYADLLPKL
ncbi:MAG: hypothetical protein Q4F72_05375 [Desulfovibrionaceae bacterium]|nr:hypothetical protein [Desulfovibrionaceae bacterium]